MIVVFLDRGSRVCEVLQRAERAQQTERAQMDSEETLVLELQKADDDVRDLPKADALTDLDAQAQAESNEADDAGELPHDANDGGNDAHKPIIGSMIAKEKGALPATACDTKLPQPACTDTISHVKLAMSKVDTDDDVEEERATGNEERYLPGADNDERDLPGANNDDAHDERDLSDADNDDAHDVEKRIVMRGDDTALPDSHALLTHKAKSVNLLA
jgi:hypothetical protein